LNKAHVRYLEARLISLAREIKKIELENATTPSIPGLTEAEQANMEVFLENVLMILPAVRIDCFVDDAVAESIPESPRDGTQGPTHARDHEPPSQSPSLELQVSKEPGKLATATQIDGKFVVDKGSWAAMEWGQKGSYPSYRSLFKELIDMGILQEEGEYRKFTKNYAFQSASAAASVVKGRPWSGPSQWKIRGQQQRSLKDWEEEIAKQPD
jgi:hypothetical protein